MKQAVATVSAVLFAFVALYFGHQRLTSGDAGAPRSVSTSPKDSAATMNVAAKSTLEPTGDLRPDRIVSALLDAAETGDVDGYRQPLCESVRAEFARTLDSVEKADRALAESMAGLKGRAVMMPEPTGRDTCVVEVELQYHDRKEGQRFHLRRSEIGWCIDRIDTARVLRQIVPYGTPVQDVALDAGDSDGASSTR